MQLNFPISLILIAFHVKNSHKQCWFDFQTITLVETSKIHERTCRWVSKVVQFHSFQWQNVDIDFVSNEKLFAHSAHFFAICLLNETNVLHFFFFYFLTDEYIQLRNINKPPQHNRNRCEQSDSGLSKFDRYRHQDDNEDDMDDGNHWF